MTPKETGLIKSSWSLVAKLDTVIVGELFYTKLFDISPEIKPMFSHISIPEQSRKLLAMLGYIISKLDHLPTILDEIGKLARRHDGYGVKPGHYALVGQALLATLETGLGDKWTPDLKEAWTKCYLILSDAMIHASEQNKQQAA